MTTQLDKRLENIENDLYGNGKQGIKTMMTATRTDLKWIKIIGGFFVTIITAILIGIANKIFGF